MVMLREGIVLEDMVIVEQCDGIAAENKRKVSVAVGTRYALFVFIDARVSTLADGSKLECLNCVRAGILAYYSIYMCMYLPE